MEYLREVKLKKPVFFQSEEQLVLPLHNNLTAITTNNGCVNLTHLLYGIENYLNETQNHFLCVTDSFFDMEKLQFYVAQNQIKKIENSKLFQKFVDVVNIVLKPTGWQFSYFNWQGKSLKKGYSPIAFLSNECFGSAHIQLFDFGIQFIIKFLFKLVMDEDIYLAKKNIVVLNQVENFLHPNLQQSLMLVLQTQFINTQFIIITKNPNIISCVRLEQLCLVDAQYELCEFSPLHVVYGEKISNVQHTILDTNPRPDIPERAELDQLLVWAESFDVDELEKNIDFNKLLKKMEYTFGKNSDVVSSVYRTIKRKNRLKQIAS